MIMIFVVGAVNDKNIPKFLRYLSLILVMLSLTVSFSQFRGAMMGLAYDPSWPKWKDELRIWKVDKNYPIKIWPPPWQITLSDK